MADTESDSDHFSDIFDSNSDLTLVIGHLDRQLRISEEAHGEEDEEKAAIKIKSLAQPQSPPPPASSSSSQAIAIDTPQLLETAQPTNKGASFPNRSLSSSASSINDDLHPTGGGAGSGAVPRAAAAAASGRGACVLERAALEIVESEGSYVMDLQQVIEGYLHDWKERACLKLDELETLFMNIEQLYAVNRHLNERLKETLGNVQLIAKCFLDLRDEFIVYTTYCTRYPDAIALLTRLLQSTHTNSLLASTQKVLNHTLPLGSYLLKPVQRILKYHLLLDNLRKHCSVAEVEEAHQQMLKVARDIDQMKKALEQKGRVRQLCGILDGWLGPELTVLGDLRHEGVLVNNSKTREVFLFDTMLIIAKPKEDRRLQFKSYIHRKDIMLVEQIPGEPCSFFVIPYSDPRNQIKFVARNRNQKRLWAHHIKSVMLEDLNIPNRAKDLVFQLGDEEDIPSEKSIKKWGHTSTPDYLERRHRYRRSEIKERSKTKAAAVAAAAAAAAKESSSLDTSTASKESFEPCCADGKDCNCAIVKRQLKEGILAKNQDCESAGGHHNPPAALSNTTTPVNKYTTNAMPKRILNLKKTRSKTVPSSVFYATLGDLSSPDLNDSSVRDGGSEDQSSITDSQEQLIPSSSLTKKEKEKEKPLVVPSRRVSFSSEAGASVPRNKSSKLRASDSHLNYNKVVVQVPVLARSNTISTEKIVSSNKVKKNTSSLYKSWRSVKEEESCLMSFQHLPGSSHMGERIANVDYADPQRLFCLKSASQRQLEELVVGSGQKAAVVGGQQRDSVVSCTSSSDSVDEGRGKVRPESFIFDRIGDDSYYEEDIERCLEDASLFRDSAIYSDDNDQRRTTRVAKSGSCSSRSPSTSSGAQEQQPPPPPVPYKPKHVTELQQRKLQELAHRKLERQLSGGKSSPNTATAQPSFLYKGN